MTRREIQRRIAKPPFLTEFLRSLTLSGDRVDPLSSAEVLRGSLPPVCLEPEDEPEEWFRGYIQTYVERDVRQLAQIGDLIAFRTMAQLAALRTGQVFAISTLARDAKLNSTTAGRYLDLLEASFLICRRGARLQRTGSSLRFLLDCF